MKAQSQNSADWWAELPPGKRTFVRDIAWMVEIMLPDEVLELRKQGEAFAPMLRCHSRRREDREPELFHPKLRPDGWWAALSAGERESFRELTRIVLLLRGSAVLEIRRRGVDVEVAWAFPEGGTAATN